MLIIIVIHERRDNMPPFNEISIRSVIDFLFDSTFVNDIQPYINILVFLGSISAFGFKICRLIYIKLRELITSHRSQTDYATRYYSEYRKELSKYYIPTRGQDIDPCNQGEIRDNNGKFISNDLLPFFIREAFNDGSAGKYYLILGDSGMGKTTFLLQLYWNCLPIFKSRKYKKAEFIPLSLPDCLQIIDSIHEKEKTILLLDALDENVDAMEDSTWFLERLTHRTSNFYKIVISCRTQFFASEKEEPSRTGQIHIGMGPKRSEILKKYISPFSDDEVRTYLRKRYRFRRNMQDRAFEIISKVPDIAARPIILNWISFLCNSEESYQYHFQIYDTIISKWIEQEEYVDNKQTLYELSIEIANYLYRNKVTVLPAKEVEKIASRKDINIKPIVAKARSLLNRNGEGEYKFAHRSFLEYFIAFEIFTKIHLPADPSYLWSLDGAKRFLFELLLSAVQETDTTQIDEVNERLAEYREYTRTNDVLEFLTSPHIQVSGRNTDKGFIVEAWLFYLPLEGYNRKDSFSVGRYFSSVNEPVYQTIQPYGADIGVQFVVTGPNIPPKAKMSIKVSHKSVSITT